MHVNFWLKLIGIQRLLSIAVVVSSEKVVKFLVFIFFICFLHMFLLTVLMVKKLYFYAALMDLVLSNYSNIWCLLWIMFFLQHNVSWNYSCLWSYFATSSFVLSNCCVIHCFQWISLRFQKHIALARHYFWKM